MTLLLAWLVFPLVLGAAALGVGLLVEELSRLRLPAALLLPVGMATIVVVSSLAVAVPSAARLAAPLVTALAAAGFVLGRPRLDRWASVAAAGTFLCYGAPVLLSGTATFAGYIKLDDTATFLALTDRAMEHGRSLAGLAPSSYEATLAVNLAQGYPLGSLLPLGVGQQLVRVDVAWLFQPWLSFCAAVLALCLYQLTEPLIPHRAARAAVAGVGAQPALLYGFALWGGVKEVAAAALLATGAALLATLRPPYRLRSLLPLAIAAAALLDALSLGGAVWLAPLGLALVPAVRRRPLAVAGAVLVAAVLAFPAVIAAGEFLRADNRTVLTSEDELGNLIGPLRPAQIVGIWPNGDFRLDPSARLTTAALVALASLAAIFSVVLAFRRRAIPLLVALAAALTGAVVYVVLGAPWLGGKALATASPFVLVAAVAGCAALRPALAGGVAAAAVAGGVAWSNALAYHDVNLAPRGQLRELERIGDRFAGEGPALMTEYQPYGVRHFLRDLDPEGVNELRRRQIPLRDGRLAGRSEFVDLDQLQLSGLLEYRTLVLRRAPTASRPPAAYRRTWAGHWYEVWQRDRPPLPIAHLPLGNALAAGATPPCRDVRRLADSGRLAAPLRRDSPAWALTDAALPDGWTRLEGGAVVPNGNGTAMLRVELTRGGEYRLWIGGSIRGELTGRIDGTRTGRVSRQLQNAGQWLDLGSRRLDAGPHRISLTVALPALQPGTGSGGFPLGPVLLEPMAPIRLLEPARPVSLCGSTLDWVEALPR